MKQLIVTFVFILALIVALEPLGLLEWPWWLIILIGSGLLKFTLDVRREVREGER